MTKIAQTKNYSKLNDAYSKLSDKREQDDSFCLVYGAPGLGKTLCSCNVLIRANGIFLRAMPGWTQKAVVRKLLNELGQDFRGTNAEGLEEVIRLVGENQRPIFVDEADFLFNDSRCLETLRAVHDSAGVPVILVGMTTLPGAQGIDRRIKRYPQISSRITQWCEFLPADWQDIRAIAQTCCDVEVEDDLLEKLLLQSRGNFRLIRRAMVKIGRKAKLLRTQSISSAQYGDDELFFQAS
ncbi:AAA family ATPase [Leptolyngbyaceae cyanobacterium UHCC 1019]